MKKILFLSASLAILFVTSCNKPATSNDNKDTTTIEAPDSVSDELAFPQDETIPTPDNSKAEAIIAKFNQGPAVNNADYADALQYAELYLTLTADPIALIHGTPDQATREAAFDKLAELQNKYPYNEQLMEILSQGAELNKTEGGLVPMNEDNRARLVDLNKKYDELAL